ncbi:MAG: PEP-CTERM sorting domain-containing protein [Armatimonadetes bacterium]|nr:PEP-CTERM sorting domain-containing protein [Armatimonadota bacterium]
MKRTLLVAALVVLATTATLAETTVGWDYTTIGDLTIYTYLLMNGETNDTILSFHVYAPMDYRQIVDWTADNGWGFAASANPSTGGADFSWYVEPGAAAGLASGEMLMVSITTPSSIETNENYLVPGTFGNWGCEFATWPGSVPIMSSTVAVPQTLIVSTPEPASLLTLCAGCLGVWIRRRKS